jgi:hypothetical protein
MISVTMVFFFFVIKELLMLNEENLLKLITAMG